MENNVVKLWEWVAKNPIKALQTIKQKEDKLLLERKAKNEEILKKYKLGKYKDTSINSNSNPSS